MRSTNKIHQSQFSRRYYCTQKLLQGTKINVTALLSQSTVDSIDSLSHSALDSKGVES